MYIYVCTSLYAIQVYGQNEELRTQLKESKKSESFLQERISKAEQKLSDLQISYDELRMFTSGEEIKTELDVLQRKMQDVKSDYGSIGVIKMHYTKEVMFSVDICM